MKKIEDLLNNIKVPLISDDYQFSALRSQLLQRFFSNQRVLTLRYRWALSLAAALFIVLAVVFISPNFADSVNTLVFGEDNSELPVKNSDAGISNSIVVEDNDSSMPAGGNSIINNNDKTYLVRQYRSPRMGRVMIVSEYNRQPQNNKIRKVSGSCY